jgi:two-component system response regulator CpxR
MKGDPHAADPGVPAILMVDDDVELCALVREYLGAHGFRVEAVHSGAEGLRRACGGGCDIVVLDVMLPGLDGFELLRQLRKRSDIPVIMLTARAAEADRVQGFAQGADDYLVKPFAAAELLGRVRAVLRRSRGGAPRSESPVAAGALFLDIGAQCAIWRGQHVPLTPTECAILEVLVRNAGRVVSRDELSAVLHQRPATPYERAVDVHMSRMRRKLEALGCEMIRTVRGTGYVCRAKS